MVRGTKVISLFSGRTGRKEGPMRTFAKWTLVVLVMATVGFGLYKGAKSLFGGTSDTAVARTNLAEAQVKTLRDQARDRQSTLRAARAELANAMRAPTARDRETYLGLTDGYLKILADAQPAESGAVTSISQTLLSHPVDQTEFDEMKATLEALAAQEFQTPDKTRADLLRKYRK